MKKTDFLFAFITFGLIQSCNSSKSLKLKIMAFNIRPDHAGESLNNGQYRKDIAAQLIKNYNIDIVGTQEVLPNQMQNLKKDHQNNLL